MLFPFLVIATIVILSTSASAQTKLWNDRALQKELEMTRDQRQELLEIKLDYEDAVEALQREIDTLSKKKYITRLSSDGLTYLEDQPEIRKQINKLTKQISEIGKEYSNKANRLLLPFQRQLIAEYALKRLISESFIVPMTRGRLSVVLDISPKQEKRIQEKKTEMEKRMKEVVAEMLNEFKEELLDELTPQQREVMQSALEDYEYSDAKNLDILRFELFFYKKRQDR